MVGEMMGRRRRERELTQDVEDYVQQCVNGGTLLRGKALL